MSAYVRLALRLIILCVLVMAVVLVSNPPTALAENCCQACGNADEICVERCGVNQSCINACMSNLSVCLKECGTCN